MQNYKPESMLAKYKWERAGRYVHETSEGFTTYLFEDDYVYIEDIYVLPEYRNAKIASQMADFVAEHAKQLGYSKMLGSVCPSANGATISLKVLLGYGFKLASSTENMIYFIKEI